MGDIYLYVFLNFYNETSLLGLQLKGSRAPPMVGSLPFLGRV